MSTLQKNLPSPQSDGFFYFFCYSSKGVNISFLVALFSVKRTKSAVSYANICIVDIAVNDVGYNPFLHFFSGNT